MITGKMSTKNVLQPIQVNNASMERSPARKRARYESPQKQRWSLNTVKLDEVYDFGVGLLVESDSDTLSDNETQPEQSTPSSCVQPPGATTPKQDTQHLSIEDWDSFITKKSIVLSQAVDYFSMLSDEVILHIFNFLPKRHLLFVSAVCGRFHRLARDESLWSRIDASGRVLLSGALGQILSRQVVILRLAQSEIQAPIIHPDSRAANENFQARLLYLDMGMAHIDTESLVVFISKCHRLKKVSLEHVTVNSDVMAMLAQNLDLEVLNLAMVEGLDVDGFKALLTKCRKLRELNIAWTYLDASTIKFVCCNLPSTLDRLNISGCRKLLADTNVADLVKSCPGLRELDLSDCTGLTGNAIQPIIELTELNFLALSRCYLIPYRSLLSLKKNESLLYLDVHGGYIELGELRKMQEVLGSHVQINKFKFSSVARPTVGARRSSIWNLRVRD